MESYFIWPNNLKMIIGKLQTMFSDCTFTVHSNSKDSFILECRGASNFRLMNQFDNKNALRLEFGDNVINNLYSIQSAVRVIVGKIFTEKFEQEVTFILELE